MKLEITKFIQENPDWEVIVTDSPFYVKTKREGIFVLLKYDQIRSDINNPTAEAGGLWCIGIQNSRGNTLSVWHYRLKRSLSETSD